MLWPSTIDLGVARSSAGRQPRAGLAHNVVSEIYREISKQISHDDLVMDFSTWAFHTALWKAAKGNITAGVFSVSRADVSYELFKRHLRLEFETNLWDNLRAEFQSVFVG